jgi:hypothetical protein
MSSTWASGQADRFATSNSFHDVVLCLREPGSVVVKADNLPVPASWIVVNDICCEATEILNIPIPNQVGETFGVGEVVMSDVVLESF